MVCPTYIDETFTPLTTPPRSISTASNYLGTTLLLLVIAKTMVLDTGVADGRALLAMDVTSGIKCAMFGLATLITIVLTWEGFKAHATTKVADYVYYSYCAISILVLTSLRFGVPLRLTANDEVGEGSDDQQEPNMETRQSIVEILGNTLQIVLVACSIVPNAWCFVGSLVLNDKRLWLMGQAVFPITLSTVMLQFVLALAHSQTTTVWETVVSRCIAHCSAAQRSAAQRSAARRTRVYLHLPTLPMLVQSQNYTAWWISHFGLKWASRIAFGVPTDLIDVATGIALGLPTYWALTRRVRPTVHANLHRFINTEKDIRQWMEQQLVLTVEMVSLNLQREFPPLH